MNKISVLSSKELKILFEHAEAKNNNKLGLSVIEKDFWVCWVLEKIFSDPELKEILCFKGGTSLSKVFNVIERFSEDIDIILHPKVLGFKLEEKVSNTQQDKFNKMLIKKGQEYIADVLKNKIENLIKPVCKIKVDEKDPYCLLINYPYTTNTGYLTPYIKLETGHLASWIPNDIYSVKPYIADILPELKIKSFKLPAIKIERTFWEKITILHSLHHIPKGKNITRYSRHYYDVYRMINSQYKENFFKNINLLAEVAAFKDRYYHSGYSRYDLAKIGTLKLLPTEKLEKEMKKDYENMAVMIYGSYPSWEEIINCLQKLEKQINTFKETLINYE